MKDLSPTIISSIISGVIALAALIVSTLVTTNKNRNEERNYFEKNLREKLENIYLPLKVTFYSKSIESALSNNEVANIVNKYGYLLNPETLNEITDLIIFEQKRNNFFEDEEYQVLRGNVINRFNKEFTELQEVYNNHFENYKKKYVEKMYEKILKVLGKFFVGITIIFYSCIISIFLYYYLNKDTTIINNPILNVLFIVVVFISVSTTVSGIGLIPAKFLEPILKKIGKTRGYFTTEDKVPQSGFYICRACNNIRKKTKYMKFGYCEGHNKREIFKSIILTNLWKSSNEKSNNSENESQANFDL
ncbi:hypothetical protein [Paenibacillus macerans]|uniref:hypothetical protein n=1 Tax=Paenibacillus macerans TaxID=44252 RepID=UPI003D31A92A